MMEILAAHESLLIKLRTFVQPWRRLTIALDGRDGAGKSTLGRYLAWQLGIPVIETDLFLDPDEEQIRYRLFDLEKVIHHRHSLNRPVLIEGVMMLHLLERLGIKTDYL